MGLMDELKRLARPYAEDEDYDDEFDDELEDDPQDSAEAPAPAAPVRPARTAPRQEAAAAPSRPSAAPVGTTASASGIGGVSPIGGLGNVVNLHTGSNLQVILVKPEKYENISEVADHLCNKCAVVLNLEITNKDTARRIVDFLSGCAYALDGNIKKVAVSTYLITPFGVEIIGDLKDELENAASYY